MYVKETDNLVLSIWAFRFFPWQKKFKFICLALGKKTEEGEDDVKFHGPYELGYTHVTMAITIGSNDESRSKARKIVPVRIIGCNSPT